MAKAKSEDVTIHQGIQGGAQTYTEKVTIQPDLPGAQARIRAFEDEHFGKDAVRIEGQIERGSGSPYAAMSGEDKARYEALEHLVETEQALANAHAALAQAEDDHAAAEKAVNA